MIFATGNLPIKALAGLSGHSAEHDEQGLSGAVGLSESGGEIIIDPGADKLRVLQPLAQFLRACILGVKRA